MSTHLPVALFTITLLWPITAGKTLKQALSDMKYNEEEFMESLWPDRKIQLPSIKMNFNISIESAYGIFKGGDNEAEDFVKFAADNPLEKSSFEGKTLVHCFSKKGGEHKFESNLFRKESVTKSSFDVAESGNTTFNIERSFLMNPVLDLDDAKIKVLIIGTGNSNETQITFSAEWANLGVYPPKSSVTNKDEAGHIFRVSSVKYLCYTTEYKKIYSLVQQFVMHRTTSKQVQAKKLF